MHIAGQVWTVIIETPQKFIKVQYLNEYYTETNNNQELKIPMLNFFCLCIRVIPLK